MASNSRVINIILKLTDDMSGGLEKASGGLKSLGDNITKIGAGMTVGLTLPLVAAGKAAVDMAMELDTAMRNIQSISKATDAEIAALSDTFVDMSTNLEMTTDTAVNLAAAFYDIQGSGFEGAAAMEVLEVATKAATAGLTETGVAAEGIAAVLNSYGQGAEHAAHVSDLMFETVNRGVGSFEELTSSMSNVVGLANTLDVPFETVSAALATMSKQGMSFSEASISLNQAMSNLLNPTREGAEIITKMGFASGEAMIASLGLDGALQAIAEHTGGSATEMGKLFSNTRSMRAALALTGDGAAMFAEDMEAMASATGSTAEAFAIQTKSFEAQFKNFQNNLNAMLIEIGQILLPIINDFLQNFILPMIQAFRSLPEPMQKAIVVILMIVAALGPLLVIIGSIVGALATLQAAFAAGGIFAAGGMLAGAIPAIMAFGAALASLAIPIGIAIAALALLKAAWDRDFLGIKTKTTEAANTWKSNFAMLGEIVKLGAQKIIGFLAELHKKIAEAGGLGAVMKQVGINIVQGLINGISSMISSLINKVKEMASKAVNSVKNAFGIASPSKVMMDFGKNVVVGFERGIETMGGIGVQTPALAPAGASTSAMSAPAIGGGMGGGGTTIIIQNLHVPLADNKEQIEYISRELGKKMNKRGVR